jgi:hypothetical protein
MAEEYVTVTCNAESVEELETALHIVSEVLAVQAVPGERLELASDLAPFDLMINLVSMTTGLYVAVGGPPVCKLLLDKLKERYGDRKVQAQFTMRGREKRTILYHAFEDTPNVALTRMAYDYEREREVESPTPMRWWAGGEWKTIEEYQEWLRRK